MSKRKSSDVYGYIHATSPQKANKSFHFRMQVDKSGKVKKAICFDKEKYSTIKEKVLSGEPVKISNVLVQEKVENQFAEIIVNKSSRVSNVDPIQMNFEIVEVEKQLITLNMDLTVGDLVSVRAKIDLKHAVEKSVVYSKKSVQVMNQAFLFDKHGDMELTIWDEWITFFKAEIEKNNTYFQFNNLLVKEFNGSLSLSTCSDTHCLLLPNEDIPEPKKESLTVVKEFDLVQNVLHQFICLNCAEGINAIDHAEFVKCESCLVSQRAKKLNTRVVVQVKAASLGESFYNLNTRELKPVVSENVDLSSFSTDKDLVIEKVMGLKNVVVEVQQENCLKIVGIDEEKIEMVSNDGKNDQGSAEDDIDEDIDL